MNKTTFLEELKRHLRVLDESEQRDILDEYAQHIDMKISRGMSEEEATRDFGDIRQLAENILEAYHVNPEYAKRGERVSKVQEKAWDAAAAAGGAVQDAGSELKHMGSWLLRGARRCANGMKRAAACCGKKLSALRARLLKKKESDEQEVLRQEEPEKVKGEKRMVRDVFGKVWNGLGNVMLWCVRWGWNLLLLGGAAVFAGVTLTTLFCFGFAVVFAVMGYPFWGLSLTSLGGVASAGALTVLLWSEIRWKKNNREELCHE